MYELKAFKENSPKNENPKVATQCRIMADADDATDVKEIADDECIVGIFNEDRHEGVYHLATSGLFKTIFNEEWKEVHRK